VDFLAKFTGAANQMLATGASGFALDGGFIELKSSPLLRSPLLNSLSIRVRQIDAVSRILSAERIPFSHSQQGILLAPPSLFGVSLRFEEGIGS